MADVGVGSCCVLCGNVIRLPHGADVYKCASCGGPICASCFDVELHTCLPCAVAVVLSRSPGGQMAGRLEAGSSQEGVRCAGPGSSDRGSLRSTRG